MTDEIQRVRHKPGTVLDQVENRNRIWNPDTLEWEASTGIEVTLPDTRFECIAFPDDLVWTHTLDAEGEVNVAETDGMATLGIGISGIWEGELIFEATMNGIDWYVYPFTDMSMGMLVGGTDVNGIFLSSCAGIYRIRVRVSEWTNGAVDVTLRASIVPHSPFIIYF